MQQSYTKNYIVIYFWQLLSVFLGLASLFIVIPYLTSNKEIFGVYSICISLNIFYSYADIGFLSAGQKYASEYYAKNEKTKEIKIMSFTGYIFFIFVSIVSIILFFLSFHPNFLISGITGVNKTIASELLIVLSISSPIIVFQRIIQSILGIRLLDYVFQRFSLFGNVIKILSVYYFLGSKQYNIVQYYIFTQFINLSIVVLSFTYAYFKLNYSWVYFFKNFKFNKKIYNETKKVAYASLILTLSWILYYEIDLFIIGKFINAESAGIYAIALSILNLFRSFFGIFYSPFTPRFNHFVGIGEFDRLKSFFVHIVNIFFPITVFSIIVVSILSKSFVLSWVGFHYMDSVPIVSILVLCNLMAFITYPAGELFVAIEKIKILYLNAILIPFIYWVGIFSTYKYLGLRTFAIFKILAFSLSAIIFLFYILKFLKIQLKTFLNKTINSYFIPLSITILLSLLIRSHLPFEKNMLNLFINLVAISSVIIIGIFTSFITSKYFREYMITLKNSILK